MHVTSTWGATLAIAVGALLLTACGAAVDDSYVIENDPGKAVPIAGTDLSRVTLTDQAAKRLGIETDAVRSTENGLVVPVAAIFVDTEGAWWVYTTAEPNEFVRHEIEIAQQNHRRAILSGGPPAETEIVTVGVAELYGIEAEVGH